MGEWNKETGVDDERAKALQAGVTASPLENLKSAWLNLKTGLGLADDKEKKPTEQK